MAGRRSRSSLGPPTELREQVADEAAAPKGRAPSPARRDDDDELPSNLPDDPLPLPPAEGAPPAGPWG
mgnify:CR=1 FL=1